MRAFGALMAFGLGAGAMAAPALAHDGVVHGSAEEAARHAAAPPDGPTGRAGALPFALGGPFALTDQTGARRTQADPAGRMQLLFFGYANCPSICSAALPMMADIVDLMAERGVAAVPVMITVDPARDTVGSMGAPLKAIHPAFVGLTGTPEALAQARTAFGVQSEVVFTDPEHGDVFAHGSHVYLLDAAGTVLTLLPPILSAEHAADIALRYAPGDS
ncbi:SCO family protein [Meridianimarinicoccus roseus]|uniref:SCO family protein n=1 Tax=Meridianimarinicoccus roseus TaxID=2072018 RepID=A0A2V2LGA1_9RHOB|nr:SCO family protein [Meridianimarinicoccus roseus]PWR02217.1 SCO family protein [Meridianimarinicoccus roseus]